MCAASVIILTVDNLRLLRMKFQAALLESFANGLQHVLSLRKAFRMDDRVIRIARKLYVRIVTPHPFVKRVMQKQIRQQGTKGLRRNNLSIFHLIFGPSWAAPQSRNPPPSTSSGQAAQDYACGFAQSSRPKLTQI